MSPVDVEPAAGRAPAALPWIEDEDRRPLRWSAALASAIFVALFLVAWPRAEVDLVERPVVYVPPTEAYVPPLKEPPPSQPERQVLEQVRKIALPDPTPERPEPIVQPVIEPPPPIAPPNARILVGPPRMPPPREPTAPVAEETAGLVKPRAIKASSPRYTREAIDADVEGVVVIEAIIDRQGRVRDARVLEGLGHGLDEAALEAVRTWTYTLGQLHGKSVEVQLRVRVKFRLE